MKSILILLAITFTTATTFAHPGKLDKNGGHTDSRVGLTSTKSPMSPKREKQIPPSRKRRSNPPSQHPAQIGRGVPLDSR